MTRREALAGGLPAEFVPAPDADALPGGPPGVRWRFTRTLGIRLTDERGFLMRADLPSPAATDDTATYRIETVSGRGLPATVDAEGYDTRLAAEAMAEAEHDGEYRIVAE